MAKQKARKTKARGGVKNLSAKNLTVQEARTVKGGDTKAATKTTTKTPVVEKYLVMKLDSTLISS